MGVAALMRYRADLTRIAPGTVCVIVGSVFTGALCTVVRVIRGRVYFGPGDYRDDAEVYVIALANGSQNPDGRNEWAAGRAELHPIAPL